MAYWFSYCIYRLDRIRLHPNSIDLTLAVVMGLLSGSAWLATTPGRLNALQLSKFWLAALVAPFAVSIYALWIGLGITGWLTLVVGVLAQWLLVFLTPDANGTPAQSNDSSERAE